MTNHYVNAYSAAIVFTLGNQLTKLYFAYLYVKLVLHSSLAGSAALPLMEACKRDCLCKLLHICGIYVGLKIATNDVI